MTIIYRDNFELDESPLPLDKLIEEMTNDPNCLSEKDNHYSSYFIKCMERLDGAYAPQYLSILENIADVKLLPTANIGINYWVQIYKNSGHGTHNHFRFNIPVSFVHFIRPSAKKCFHFVQGDEKIYPKQDPGDLILFPSWANHGVDESPGDEWRVVVAGNFMISSFVSESLIHRYYVHDSHDRVETETIAKR